MSENTTKPERRRVTSESKCCGGAVNLLCNVYIDPGGSTPTIHFGYVIRCGRCKEPSVFKTFASIPGLRSDAVWSKIRSNHGSACLFKLSDFHLEPVGKERSIEPEDAPF